MSDPVRAYFDEIDHMQSVARLRAELSAAQTSLAAALTENEALRRDFDAAAQLNESGTGATFRAIGDYDSARIESLVGENLALHTCLAAALKVIETLKGQEQ